MAAAFGGETRLRTVCGRFAVSWAAASGISSAPAARKKNRTLYSDGRQDYTPGIRSMFGRKFLINPQKDAFRGYYNGKNS
jgi:hypothetical protein